MIVYEYISVVGRLAVIHDRQTVFSADAAAVEFYWYISKWVEAGSIRQKRTFRKNDVFRLLLLKKIF